MTEKIDFRLGGSSDKGEVYKTFEELEKGDKVYTYSVQHRGDMCVTEKKDYELEEVKRRAKDNAISLVTNTYIHITFNIQPENSESQIACMSKFYDVSTKDYVWWIISTMPNADSEAKVVAEEAMKNETIEKKKLSRRSKKMTTDESVDFRLGGSQNKDGRAEIKPFDKLEEDDNLYIYSVRNGNSVERTKDTIVSYEIYNGDISNYKEVEISLANLDHPIVIFMTDEDLSKPYYVAGPKSKVFSTYEMTDGEVIDALKNHSNY